jgi:hypothetical protein
MNFQPATPGWKMHPMSESLHGIETMKGMRPKIFHIYNRSNGRHPLFLEEENYTFFILKMSRQLANVAHLLAYCLMPNHFHFLLIPKDPIREGYLLDGEVHETMPTKELSEAMRRLTMGYTKSLNLHLGLTGSRFQQHAKAKYHGDKIKPGMDYIHDNPTEAGLASHPSEWAFSSHNEYFGPIPVNECFCDVELGRKLLLL